MQIEAYVRTNNDLDNERRVRHDCETQVLKLEADLKEARQTLDMLQMENKRKADENKHSQVNIPLLGFGRFQGMTKKRLMKSYEINQNLE